MIGVHDRADAPPRDPMTGEVYLNRAELAWAFEATEPMIDPSVAAGYPAVEKGSNGPAYKLLAS